MKIKKSNLLQQDDNGFSYRPRERSNFDHQIVDQLLLLQRHRVKQLFEEVATESPEEIISRLVTSGERWLNGSAQNDDMTFVVVHVKKSSPPGQGLGGD